MLSWTITRNSLTFQLKPPEITQGVLFCSLDDILGRGRYVVKIFAIFPSHKALYHPRKRENPLNHLPHEIGVRSPCCGIVSVKASAGCDLNSRLDRKSTRL